MGHTLEIRHEAEIDLYDAVVYYTTVSIDLAVRFRTSVAAAFTTIQENPQLFPLVHRDVRKAFIGTFP